MANGRRKPAGTAQKPAGVSRLVQHKNQPAYAGRSPIKQDEHADQVD